MEIERLHDSSQTPGDNSGWPWCCIQWVLYHCAHPSVFSYCTSQVFSWPEVELKLTAFICLTLVLVYCYCSLFFFFFHASIPFLLIWVAGGYIILSTLCMRWSFSVKYISDNVLTRYLMILWVVMFLRHCCRMESSLCWVLCPLNLLWRYSKFS